MYSYVQFRTEDDLGGGFVEYKTDDIDATLAKVESLGGKILMAKTEIPHVGWWAIFTGLPGNKVAL